MTRRVPTTAIVLGPLALAAGPVLTGCQPPGAWPRGPTLTGNTRRPVAPDIVRVVCFYTQPIFLSFDPEGDPNPEGFRCTMYLVSRETGKGVHADGTLRVKMFRLDRSPDGKITRNLAHEWVVPTAVLPRAKKETALGWGYAPQFNWGDTHVLGKEIELVFYFELPDGRVARSQPFHRKVPARKF